MKYCYLWVKIDLSEHKRLYIAQKNSHYFRWAILRNREKLLLVSFTRNEANETENLDCGA